MAISGRRSMSIMTVYCNMGAFLVALLVVGAPGVVQARVVIEAGCPEEEYAYPFQSVCQEPAELDTEYHLVSPFSNAAVAQGGFTPDDNSFIRFTGNKSDEGATYVFLPVSAEGDTVNITLGTPVALLNPRTKRKLGWAVDPFKGGYLLAELENPNTETQFLLQLACPVSLPCPETTGARCESYFFLSSVRTFITTNLTAGFISATSHLNAGSYVKHDSKGTSGNLPLLLRRPYHSDSNNIRQVVA